MGNDRTSSSGGSESQSNPSVFDGRLGARSKRCLTVVECKQELYSVPLLSLLS